MGSSYPCFRYVISSEVPMDVTERKNKMSRMKLVHPVGN
jgi:hypothetical protein